MRSSSFSKGQWMLISAVIVVGTFLSISLVFRDFFVVDASVTARGNGGFYLNNLEGQFENVVDKSPCANLQKNVDDFIAFSKMKLWEQGYFVYIEYQQTAGKTQSYNYQCQEFQPGPVPPAQPKIRDVGKGIIVATEGSIFYSGMDLAHVNIVMPGVE